ncbi:MAG: tRNA pseudouridine(55) synthase TruB [Angelakisella sp.]
MLEGIICIDKPEDFTSFDVVAKSRGITRCRKMGHGGTLDPMATGVLPLFLGRAAKAMDIMPVQDKRYTAGFCLGMTTDTQDSTGTVLSRSTQPVSLAQLTAVLPAFRGSIDQLPPMYSAVQLDGQRLYDLARQGRTVDRPTREVTVHQLELLDYDPASRTGKLDVSCSKGTFIRTILHDIGELLGCGAVMTSLRRTETLGYTLQHCVTLAELQVLADTGMLERRLLPISTIFASCPRLALTPRQAVMFHNGVRLDTNRIPDAVSAGQVAVWADQLFLGTAVVDLDNAELLPQKLFYLGALPPA